MLPDTPSLKRLPACPGKSQHNEIDDMIRTGLRPVALPHLVLVLALVTAWLADGAGGLKGPPGVPVSVQGRS